MTKDKILWFSEISFMIFILFEGTHLLFPDGRIYIKTGSGYINLSIIKQILFFPLSFVALYLSIRVMIFGFRSQNKFRLLPFILSLPIVILFLILIVRMVFYLLSEVETSDPYACSLRLHPLSGNILRPGWYKSRVAIALSPASLDAPVGVGL